MSNQLPKTILTKIKNHLESEKIRLAQQIEELHQDDPFTDPDHTIDNAAVDTDVREKMGHETIEAQIMSLARKSESVAAALIKINADSYGFCESCKNPIPQARLEVIPESPYCITCESRLIK